MLDECHVIVAHRFPVQTCFFTLDTYRRQALLTHGQVLTALRSAHRVVRATHPFRVDAMVVLPDHRHTVWSLRGRSAEIGAAIQHLREQRRRVESLK